MRKPILSYPQLVLLIVGICAIAVAQGIYALGWDNAFVSDDWFFLYGVAQVNNVAQLLTLASFQTDWFVRPTQWFVTFALYRLFGLTPQPYHILAQALDLLNALLVGSLVFQLLSLSKQFEKSRNIVLSALVVGLFLLNVRHHEVVFWYSAFNELLTAFFKLSALNAVLWWLAHKQQYWLVLSVAMLAMGLAILSKESALLLPIETLLLVIYAAVAQRQGSPQWKRGLFIVGAQFLVVGIWAYFYVQYSRPDSESVARGGLQLLNAAPVDWLLRLAQFLNANYIGTDFVARNAFVLGAELFLLGALCGVAILRKQWLWFVAVVWTILAVAPYVALTSENAVRAVLARGIGGDRYLYYSAAAAGLLLIATFVWMRDELAHRTGTIKLVPFLLGLATLGFVSLSSVQAYTLYNMEQEWDAAGKISTRVLAQVQKFVPSPTAKDVFCFIDLPTQVKKKYVFQNGISQALYLAYARNDFRVETFRATKDVPTPVLPAGCTAVLKYRVQQNGLERIE